VTALDSRSFITKKCSHVKYVNARKVIVIMLIILIAFV